MAVAIYLWGKGVKENTDRLCKSNHVREYSYTRTNFHKYLKINFRSTLFSCVLLKKIMTCVDTFHVNLLTCEL